MDNGSYKLYYGICSLKKTQNFFIYMHIILPPGCPLPWYKTKRIRLIHQKLHATSPNCNRKKAPCDKVKSQRDSPLCTYNNYVCNNTHQTVLRRIPSPPKCKCQGAMAVEDTHSWCLPMRFNEGLVLGDCLLTYRGVVMVFRGVTVEL